MRPFASALCGLTLFSTSAYAQTALPANIARIALDAHGSVSVACLLPGTALNCDLQPHAHAPMQSVFKFPLALTVLQLAERGKLFPDQKAGEPIGTTLDHGVRFLPEDRIAHTYSPLQDRYPEANVDIPLRELLQLSAGQSDNAATEVLLRIVGGPAEVERYLHSLGIAAFRLQDGEHELARDNTAQYRNWIEPAAAIQLLQQLDHSPLSPDASAFLMQTLANSVTGRTRLRAGLPVGTPLAHKTGTSGEQDGKAAATNDIGLVTLPDGRHLAVAVFVSDARADEATRDSVIARIGQAVYNEALHTH